jgi:hypothetical protein
VIPTFPARYDVTPFMAVPRHTRCIFILGENDPANSQSRRVIASLEAAGAFIQTRTMGGAGHDLPQDFTMYVWEALDRLELG